MDEKYTGLKKQLSELCGLKPEQILLAEVHTANIKVLTRFYGSTCRHKVGGNRIRSLMSQIVVFRTFLRTTTRSVSPLMASCVRLRSPCRVRQPH